jgi:hypothetical protein
MTSLEKHKPSGYYVITNDETNPSSMVVEALKTLTDYGMVNLKNVRMLNRVTAGKFKNQIKNSKPINEAQREKRKAYQKRPDVMMKRKEYSAKPEVKERRKEMQKKKAALLKTLRERTPDLYYLSLDNPSQLVEKHV